MRTVFSILTILILTMGVGFGQANIYHPFPDSNAIWNEVTLRYTGVGNPPSYKKYTYFTNGDTLINSMTYHKVYFADSSSTKYYGAYRELDKRIYFISHLPNCTEVTIYDFNLQVGDIVNITCDVCNTWMDYTNKVSSIDSVLIEDMTYRKRINFDWYLTSWIEGIGDTDNGVFYRGHNCASGTDVKKLVCFKQNSSLLYLDESAVPCFQIFVATNELINSLIKLNIYHNPINNQTTIMSSQKLFNLTLILYNSSGQQVKQISNISGESITLSWDNLASGLYVLKLYQANQILAIKKLIIKDN